MGDEQSSRPAATRNIKLNLLKGFACFGVVFIHIQFPGLFGQLMRYAAGFAVPIFFMTAGYYHFNKGAESIKKGLLNIIKILAAAYCYFFLYNIIHEMLNHSLGTWFADNFNWFTPVKFIVFCTIDFAIPLWYLIAMAEVYICWLFIVKKGKEQTALVFIPVLFILRIVLTGYCDIMHLEWFWKINFLTDGMSWFLLGYYLHTPQAKPIRDLSSFKLVLLAVAGLIITVIPAFSDLAFKFNAIGIIPYSLALFTLIFKSPDTSVCKPLEFIGERLSLYIYVLHVVFAEAMDDILTRTGFNIKNITYEWMRPLIVLTLAIAASFVCYYFFNIREKNAGHEAPGSRA